MVNRYTVSIHAPAWGATVNNLAKQFNSKLFQSTHPRGVRPIGSLVGGNAEKFQSTHPRGVRLRFLRLRTILL